MSDITYFLLVLVVFLVVTSPWIKPLTDKIPLDPCMKYMVTGVVFVIVIWIIYYVVNRREQFTNKRKKVRFSTM